MSGLAGQDWAGRARMAAGRLVAQPGHASRVHVITGDVTMPAEKRAALLSLALRAQADVELDDTDREALKRQEMGVPA